MPAYRQAINTPLAPPHSALRHTYVLTPTDAHTHGEADTCTHKCTLPPPPSLSQQLRFWRGRKSLLTAAAVFFFLPLFCWSSLFFCLFQHFSQSLKPCCLPSFCFLKEHWLFPFLTYSSRGNRSCNTLPEVQWRVNVLFMAKGVSIMLSGKCAAERWLGCRWCWNEHKQIHILTRTHAHTHTHTHTHWNMVTN